MGYLTLQSTCTAVGYFKSCGFKKKVKLDCSEFSAVKINTVVDSTYGNYQSPNFWHQISDLSSINMEDAFHWFQNTLLWPFKKQISGKLILYIWFSFGVIGLFCFKPLTIKLNFTLDFSLYSTNHNEKGVNDFIRYYPFLSSCFSFL